MDTAERHPSPSPERFVRGDSTAPQKVTHIEGAAEAGDLAIKPMIVGEDMLIMEVHRAKGLIDPLQSHADHESMCYLVSGRMKVEIDGESFLAGPGDAWVHPAGVPHRHEALEDCVQIEVKSPPSKTWR